MAVAVVTNMAIKWRLKQLLANREKSVGELVEVLDMHRTTVSKLVNRYDMPRRLTPETLEAICRFLDCKPGDLIEMVD